MIGSFFTVILPVFALFCGGIEALVWHFLKKKRTLPPLIRRTALWVFLTYALSLLFLTVLSNLYIRGPVVRRLNLRPFDFLLHEYGDVREMQIKQLFLNIGMFVPEGFLLPILFPKLRKASRLLPTVLATTVGIETVQFFIGRSADIDDVLMNFAGGVIGFGLYLLCGRLFRNRGRWKTTTGAA